MIDEWVGIIDEAKVFNWGGIVLLADELEKKEDWIVVAKVDW